MTDKLVENMERAITAYNELWETLREIIISLAEWFSEAYKGINARSLHLARYSKSKRVRKKNAKKFAKMLDLC